MNLKPTLLLIIATLFSFKGMANPNPPSGTHAFVNVSVIPMDKETVKANQTVLVKDGKIVAIGNTGKVKIPEGAIQIDGKGKFLMPGIAEMHAHIPVANEGNDEDVRDVLFLYLSNGITTIRGMLGQPYHLQLKKEVAAGEILSPRIYTSGPSMNGNSVQSKEEADRKVQQYKNDGYDFLKIHPGITRENFDQIAKTAKEVGIPYAGHVPVDVGVEHAIKTKFASIDHLDGYVEGLVPSSAGVNPNENGFFGVNFTDKIDENKISELAKMTKKAKVWVVPTQSLMPNFLDDTDPNVYASRPEMKYLPSKTIFQWKSVKGQLTSNPEYDVELVNRFFDLRDKILKSLHDEGVDIILGSDAPQVFNVPGFSIQHEMRSMVKVGMTPYEVLHTGTCNPARYFNEKGAYGVVKKGASADLILLNANPLEDIKNMELIEGVMVRGQWLSRAFIDENLERIAKKHEGEGS